MNRAATTDFRVFRVWPVVAAVLSRGGLRPPSDRARRMFDLLNDYRRRGASRLDRDLDGTVDHPGGRSSTPPGCASRTPCWDRCSGPQLEGPNGIGGPIRRAERPSPTAASWYSTRTCGRCSVAACRGRFANRYCGRGDLRRLPPALWSAIEAAGDRAAAAQGPDPAAWRADADDRADRVRARRARHQDPVHEPSQRHPAGRLLQGPPAALAPAPPCLSDAARRETRPPRGARDRAVRITACCASASGARCASAAPRRSADALIAALEDCRRERLAAGLGGRRPHHGPLGSHRRPRLPAGAHAHAGPLRGHDLPEPP